MKTVTRSRRASKDWMDVDPDSTIVIAIMSQWLKIVSMQAPSLYPSIVLTDMIRLTDLKDEFSSDVEVVYYMATGRTNLLDSS